MTWEERWHPLREEWVIVAAHRNDRPWVGETVTTDRQQGAADAVTAVADEYRRAAGHTPRVLTGSSMGACDFGVVRYPAGGQRLRNG